MSMSYIVYPALLALLVAVLEIRSEKGIVKPCPNTPTFTAWWEPKHFKEGDNITFHFEMVSEVSLEGPFLGTAHIYLPKYPYPLAGVDNYPLKCSDLKKSKFHGIIKCPAEKGEKISFKQSVPFSYDDDFFSDLYPGFNNTLYTKLLNEKKEVVFCANFTVQIPDYPDYY